MCKVSEITMDRNLQKFDPHEIKQPYHTVLNLQKFDPHEIKQPYHTVLIVTIINTNIPYNWPAGC